MLFPELRFLLFFALVFCAHWALPGLRSRKLLLLGASYVFYGAWDWRFLSLIWISTLVDYVCGSMLDRTSIPRKRSAWLWLSLLVNLGLLGTFKYLGFFVESGTAFLEMLGLPVATRTLEILLPVGISFYTFQTLSYTLDVYGRKIRPTHSLLDFALFVGFFPQLVAGPIVRARDFLPQLARRARLSDIAFRSHLTLFLFGYVKKACISDNFATLVDPVFANPTHYCGTAKWLATHLFTIQVYCDFSGYSDMAIATAGLLGYSLGLNFDFPLLSRHVTDFWRRWHISLSSWFRDYLYIPLGGGRKGGLSPYVNLFAVFLVSGLWHGAAWTFVLFGSVHGAATCLEKRFLPRSTRAGSSTKRTFNPLRSLYPFYVFLLSLVLFRADSLSTAGTFYLGMVGVGNPDLPLPVSPYWVIPLVGFMVVHMGHYLRIGHDRLASLPSWAFAGLYALAVAAALPFATGGTQPFIYFQF